MASPELLKLKIHAAIVQAVSEATFPQISFAVVGDSASPVMDVLDDTQALAPRSITVYEARSTFRPASRNRRTMTYERDQWLWNLFMDFDREVSLEDFENRILERGLVIPADPVSGNLQVTVTLQSVPIRNPPQRGASGGTSVNYLLVAQVHPK